MYRFCLCAYTVGLCDLKQTPQSVIHGIDTSSKNLSFLQGNSQQDAAKLTYRSEKLRSASKHS